MSTTTSSWSARLVDSLASRLPSASRRNVLVGAAVGGSAMVVDPKAYALTNVTAYSTVCGPGNTAASGWTVFCATINDGENACPPGSFAAGWWKAAGSSWCGNRYRYIVDCNARCTQCSTGCSDGICSSSCWNCSCRTGSSATCDQRRICCNAFRYGQCNTQVSCSGGVHCRIVSCTPPYEWENCTTTSLRDDRTTEHSTPLVPEYGILASRARLMGDQKSYLGHSMGPVRRVGDGRGTYISYSGGAIYYKEGARTSHAVRAAGVAALERAGGVRGSLGYPVVKEYMSQNGGITQRCERGAVSGPSRTELYPVYGGAYWRWTELTRAAGPLDYPVGDRQNVPGGWVQHFQGGAVCQRGGTKSAAVHGVMAERWYAAGAEDGVLGLATSAVGDRARGSTQKFVGGHMWALDGGVPRRVTGPVLQAWLSERGHVGRYGYPIGDTTRRSDGRWQCAFEGGMIVA